MGAVPLRIACAGHSSLAAHTAGRATAATAHQLADRAHALLSTVSDTLMRHTLALPHTNCPASLSHTGAAESAIEFHPASFCTFIGLCKHPHDSDPAIYIFIL